MQFCPSRGTHVYFMSVTSMHQFGRQLYNKIPEQEPKKRDVLVIAIEGYVPDKSLYSAPLCSKLSRSGIDTVDLNLNMWSEHLFLNGHEGIPVTVLSLIYEAYSIRKERGKFSAVIVPNLPEDLLTFSPKYQRSLETAIKLLRHAINPSMVVYLDSPIGNIEHEKMSQSSSAVIHNYTQNRAFKMKNILKESYSNVLTINALKPMEEVVTQMYDMAITLLRR